MHRTDRFSRRGALRIAGAAGLAAAASGALAADPAPPPGAGDAVGAIKDWPETSRRAATDMLRRYGPPQEVTRTMLLWRDIGPWTRIIAHRSGAEHAFPSPHEDVIEQVVAYKVPLNFFNALAVYNGSVVPHRTRGELSSTSDGEPGNIVALNLAHEIVRGRMTAEQAREAHAAAARDLLAGGTPELAAKLAIERPQGDLADPDTPVLAGAPGGK